MPKFFPCLLATALAVGLLPVSAMAESACDTTLAEVHAAGSGPGPFRAITTALFFRDGKPSGSMEAVHDTILPDRFRHVSMNNRGKFNGSLIIGDKGWDEDLGAPRTGMQPRLVESLTRTFRMEYPFPLEGAADVACSAGPDHNGRQVATFSWSLANKESATTWSLVADAGTRLPLRLHWEMLFKGQRDAAFDTVFRFDPLITIEPPPG